MSKRLIDANELISAMYYYEHNESGLTAYDAQDIINKAPTIEPKRGENLRKEYPSLFECSVCGAMCDDTYTFDCDINFCPNCGASMRGGHNE